MLARSNFFSAVISGSEPTNLLHKGKIDRFWFRQEIPGFLGVARSSRLCSAASAICFDFR
jgi:hypothetical protein